MSASSGRYLFSTAQERRWQEFHILNVALRNAGQRRSHILEFIEIYDRLVACSTCNRMERRPVPRYRDIRERPIQVLDLTSLLPDEFELIVPAFDRRFQAPMDQWTMTGQPR